MQEALTALGCTARVREMPATTRTAAAGTPSAVFPTSPAELERLTGAEVLVVS